MTLLLLACGGSGDGDAVDTGDAVGPTLLLDATPDFVARTPSNDAGPVLFDVQDVLPLSDGRVAVANGGSSEILIYDDAGVLLQRWGGAGDGPGEFRRVAWLAEIAGDSIAAGDPALRRISVFDSDGRIGRTIAVRVDPGKSGGRAAGPASPLGVLRSGAVVAAYYDGPEPREGHSRPLVRQKRYAHVGDQEVVQRLSEDLRSISHHTHAPTIGAIRSRGGDRVWVREYAASRSDSVRWNLWDGQGRHRARLTVPAEFRVLWFGSDRAVGVWIDSLGVEEIRGYAFAVPSRNDG